MVKYGFSILLIYIMKYITTFLSNYDKNMKMGVDCIMKYNSHVKNLTDKYMENMFSRLNSLVLLPKQKENTEFLHKDSVGINKERSK